MDIRGHNIERIAVVDDDQNGRKTLASELRDAKFTPIEFGGQYGNIEGLVGAVLGSGSQGVICDYRLNTQNYVYGNGAQALVEFHKVKFPAILFTSDIAAVNEIRPFRPYIPVLLDKQEIEEPEVIVQGLRTCVGELEGDFLPERRPWQTLVSILSIHGHYIEVEIPAWNTSKSIGLTSKVFPEEILKILAPDMDLFARVNIGAENADDLYFTNWENRGDNNWQQN